MWSAATGTHTRRMPLLIPSHFRYIDKHSNSTASNKNSSSSNDVSHVTSQSVTAGDGPLGVTVEGETAMITCAAFALPHERRLVC